MLQGISPLWPFFKQNQLQGKPLVLATIVTCSGSTYKKVGAMMLIDHKLNFCGLLSGGCLESDVAEHARHLFDGGDPQLLTYDLSDESMFGLGAGCDGAIQVLLQKIDVANSYQPFSLLNPFEPFEASLYLHYKNGADQGGFALEKNNKEMVAATGLTNKAKAHDACHIKIQPPPSICIAGAGVDARPVARCMAMLYWQGLVLDHRSGLLRPEFFPEHWHLQRVSLADEKLLSLSVSESLDAVVIMSHSIEKDAAYLRFFAQQPITYIGLLGPVARKQKVIEASGVSEAQLAARLSSPVGLNLGGRLAEHIALSITAEIQQHLNQLSL